MNTFEIRSLRLDEREHLLTLINQEFIISRGRTLGLEERFPRLFSKHNLENFLVALDKSGKILSVCGSEPRTMRKSGDTVFLVGCVMTVPEARGKGLAGSLLKQLESHFLNHGAKAAFLWTGLNGFYEQFGWKREDHTELLILRNAMWEGGEEVYPNAAHCAWEQLAASDCGTFLRNAQDYFSILPPADSALQYLLDDGSFLCGGYRDGMGYIYDLHASSYKRLYTLLSSFARQTKVVEIWLNLLPDHHATEMAWLKEMFDEIEVKKPDLQMYWAADADAAMRYKSITIPFIDRI